jgi:hypothetical protein
MFDFHTATVTTTASVVRPAPPAAGAVLASLGTVVRIGTARDGVAYAAMNGVRWNVAGNTVTNNTVLRREWVPAGAVLGPQPPQWVARAAGLPVGEPFYALDVDSTVKPAVAFVATDRNVYVTRDDGKTWADASRGLPARPHCSDLRVVQDVRATYAYLSTWGRSVWITRIHTEAGAPLFP